MADKSELNKMLTEFAEFLGTENKTLADAITAKVDQLKQTIMGGEVDEELDTFRELIAEFKKIKTAQGDTPEFILNKFTELEGKINDLTGTVGTNKPQLKVWLILLKKLPILLNNWLKKPRLL